MTEKADCGHPAGCLDDEDECQWCADVRHLRGKIDALMVADKLIIVHDGHVHIGGDAHYLEVHGGVVDLAGKGEITTRGMPEMVVAGKTITSQNF